MMKEVTMQVFVINLDKNQDRCRHMTQQLERLGIAFERLPAVYGQALSRKELRASFSKFRSFCAIGKRLSIGAVGCALSHGKVYQQMIERKIPYALILEDDILIDETIHTQLDKVSKFIDVNKAQVVVLSALEFHGGETRGIFRNNRAICADGYVITLEAAKTIYHANMPVVSEADAWYRWYRRFGLEVYNAWPACIRQDNGAFGTDINTMNRWNVVGWQKLIYKAIRVPELLIDRIWFFITGK